MWPSGSTWPEQAKVDAFFFADAMGLQGEYNGSRDIVFETANTPPKT
ncbi:hypothetical protein ABQE93_05140 [Mycolicibacterium sp. XJ662]